jgi:hypothetical protein
MPKKCPPGVICFENITLVSILIVLGIVLYFIYLYLIKPAILEDPNKFFIFNSPARMNPLASISARHDPFNDPYSPPLKQNGYYHPRDSSDVRGIPVNVSTRGVEQSFQQMGILTRMNGTELILPLMGRRSVTGRDKFEYYAISNTGSVNTKLPISVNGKSCSREYGCEDINNGDSVFVQGYNDAFQVTMYENDTFRYIPYL